MLNGDQVPIDGIILSGTTSIDESSINGESIPKEKSKGDEVFGSTINGTGTFTMEVTKENKDTVFSKILQLVSQNQDNQTKAASIIQKFEPKYVNIVLIAIPLVMLLAPFYLIDMVAKCLQGISAFSRSFTVCFGSSYCICNIVYNI